MTTNYPASTPNLLSDSDVKLAIDEWEVSPSSPRPVEKEAKPDKTTSSRTGLKNRNTRYQVTTSNGNTLTFETELTAKQAFAVVAAIEPRTSFLEWILKGSEYATEKQILWALKTAQDEINRRNPEVGPGPYINLVKKIREMQAGAKARVILRFEGLTLKAVTRGENLGSVYLYKGREYAGKVTAEGYIRADLAVRDIIDRIAADPGKAAREYGRATGSCSCCGRPLSDPVSVFGGIGPTCLAKLAGESAREDLVQDYQDHVSSNLLDQILATA
jgi:hypothetical protein